MLLISMVAAVTATPAASLPLRPMHQPLPANQQECENATTYQADQGIPRARARRLDELPPGRLELTVMRSFNGCPMPAVLRDGIGGNPEGQREEANRR